MRRRAGILLHPTSLPGPYGIGEIGPAARELLAWLDAAEQRVWQMLPLHPVDDHGSPYATPTAFARNPQLVSIDDLVTDGWLLPSERPEVPGRVDRVDYATAHRARRPALHAAGRRVVAQVDLEPWAEARTWLRDWALFRAIAEERGGDWTAWPAPLRRRDPRALEKAQDRLQDGIRLQLALQWLFEQQWGRLREDARARDIELWGDVPFFVSHGSADVWANQGLFRLDAKGRPTHVSGVPPDAFSETGQLWGHPLYDVEAQERGEFAWWVERIRAVLEVVDTVRLDHFRGIAAFWETPAGARDARGGQWVPGPGAGMLEAIARELGSVPLIAEDLGVITPDVEALRDRFDLPGMAVLQFAFDSDARNPYLPHNHRRNQVVYPGTHDNDTSVGWYRSAAEHTRDHLRRYLTVDGHDVAWDLARCAWRSVCDTAVVAMQDLLALDAHARMNVPGRSEGNWGWRMGREALSVAVAHRVADETRVSGRS